MKQPRCGSSQWGRTRRTTNQRCTITLGFDIGNQKVCFYTHRHDFSSMHCPVNCSGQHWATQLARPAAPPTRWTTKSFPSFPQQFQCLGRQLSNTEQVVNPCHADWHLVNVTHHVTTFHILQTHSMDKMICSLQIHIVVIILLIVSCQRI